MWISSVVVKSFCWIFDLIGRFASTRPWGSKRQSYVESLRVLFPSLWIGLGPDFLHQRTKISRVGRCIVRLLHLGKAACQSSSHRSAILTPSHTKPTAAEVSLVKNEPLATCQDHGF
jgi:hypothetical protein